MHLLVAPAWAISGGTEDRTDTAVVGFIDSDTSAECTGALIAPDVVLTARHCVSAIEGFGCEATFGATFSPGRLFVTTLPQFSFDVRDYRAVEQILVDADQPAVCGGDVAILILAEDVADVAPLAVRLDPLVAGEPYSAVGYGGTDSEGTGSGTRRRRDGLTVACVGDCSGQPANEWRGEAGICGGDSGGPALEAEGRVAGVVSRGEFGCTNPVYADLSAWAGWLRETANGAAEAGDYPVPDWADEPDPDTDPADTDPADTDDVLTDDSGGCGCASSGTAGGLPLVLAWLVSYRSRRSHLTKTP